MQAAATLAVVETNLRIWRRAWRGSAVSAFVSPALFLAALGLGLGRLVEGGTQLGGVDYVAFLAPGLMVANAMQTAAGESTWALRSRMTRRRTLQGMVATPVTVGDLVAGHLAVIALRTLLTAVVFAVVVAVFGVAPLPRALAAVPSTVLTVVAVSALISAFSAHVSRDEHLPTLFRFAITPMILLTGTFFPVDRLPVALHALAAATPLYHGIALTRTAMAGTALPWPAVLHVAHLGVTLAIGWWLFRLALTRKLHP